MVETTVAMEVASLTVGARGSAPRGHVPLYF